MSICCRTPYINVPNTLAPKQSSTTGAGVLNERPDPGLHEKWKQGEVSLTEKEKIHKETVDNLQKCAVTKERNAWTDVPRKPDSRAVWEKINCNGTFEGYLTSSKPLLEDLKK